MQRSNFSSRAVLAGALALFALTACSDSATTPEVEPEPVDALVFLRGTNDLIADTHGDHWHGSIELAPGQEIEVDVRFLDADGEVIPLGGEYTVQAEIAPGQPTGIATVEAHGDHLDIEAEAVGETRILIHFWHDGHADWTTPPLRVVVSEP